MTGPCNENSHPILIVRASLKTTEKNSCSHKKWGCCWISLSMTRVWAQLLGCSRKAFFGSLEVVSSIPKYPWSASLLQTSTGLLRSLQNRSDRNNKGKSVRRLQEDRWRFNHTSPAYTRLFVCPVPCSLWHRDADATALLFSICVLVTFPCLSLLFLGSDYPLLFFFFLNDPCPAWSHVLTSPLAFFSFSQCGADPRGTGRGIRLARSSCG